MFFYVKKGTIQFKDGIVNIPRVGTEEQIIVHVDVWF
jgi:hypothetical protein